MFQLPKLNYEYNAFEPHIDARTMEIHHSRHHSTYVDKLNDAIKGTNFENKSLAEILAEDNLPDVIRNNAGGHFNHSFFWEIITPAGATAPQGALLEAIEGAFGSFENFKAEFEKAALGRFGSGWAWLIKTKEGLKITSTPNQDNPLMVGVEYGGLPAQTGTPILALDVWEHAYYLRYQNKRAEYIAAWWNIVNWQKAGEIFDNS